MTKTDRYRDIHRGKTKKYVGLLYYAIIILFCLTLSLFAWQFVEFKSIHILFILFSILIANFVEYSLHRFILHIKQQGLGGVYKTHSGHHHRFFTNENMSIDECGDIGHVITGIKVVGLFVSFIILPLSLIFGVINFQLGLIFFITALNYYSIYETTHLICHLPDTNILTKLPYFKNRKKHHQDHHNPKEMRDINFNVSAPLMDYIFRTKKK